MANLKNRLVHVTVGYDELPDSPIKVDDENGLLDFLRDSVGVLHNGKGSWLTDEQAKQQSFSFVLVDYLIPCNVLYL